MPRRIVILTEGFTEPHRGKTATSLIRYRADEVVALLDAEVAGRTSGELLGVGSAPVIAKLADAPEADTLLLGIAPPGGKIPPSWRAILKEAIARNMNIVSGLHELLNEDAELVEAAATQGVQLIDVRSNQEKDIAERMGIRSDTYRLHTVGHDCTVGKMVTSIELTEGLKRRGRDAQFVATGQTGIMVSGAGCPVDRVIADFINGAAERLVLQNQDHELLLIEGQGSLVHPSYSAVTLGLLHGCLPHALIMCYEVGRTRVTGLEHVEIPPLSSIRQLYDAMANIHQACEFIGVSMNSRKVSAEEAEAERERVGAELGLPVCDVFRHGPDTLLDAVEQHYEGGRWRESK